MTREWSVQYEVSAAAGIDELRKAAKYVIAQMKPQGQGGLTYERVTEFFGEQGYSDILVLEMSVAVDPGPDISNETRLAQFEQQMKDQLGGKWFGRSGRSVKFAR